jgi:hypothetical protein
MAGRHYDQTAAGVICAQRARIAPSRAGVNIEYCARLAMPAAWRFLLCAALIACAACSDRKAVETPRPSVIDPQLKAIEAARSVEGTLKEQDEARRRLIDGTDKQ